MKKTKSKEAMKYRLLIDWSPDDQCYLVQVPELPGCVTHGKTPEEATQMAHEVIEAHLEVLKNRRLLHRSK
jgi:predicted RNase H-like HicB family nuclease